MTEQLAFSLSSREESQFSDFLPTRSTRLAVGELQKFARHQSEQFIYLCGETGSGKSHLLHATCHALMQQGELPVYLSMAQPYLSPEAFTDLEQQSVVCLDDFDHVVGNEQWEETLFHFYNRCQEQKTQLLIAAHKPAAKLPFVLADLKSRMCHGLTLVIKPLKDAEKIYVLQQKAYQMGMDLPVEIGAYLLRHVSMDMTILMDCLDKLDQVSLVEQRKLTIPFIRSALNLG